MDIVPNFELGIWNAWMFMLVLYAAAFIPLMIKSENAEKKMEGEPKGNEVKKSSEDNQHNNPCDHYAFDLDFEHFPTD